MTQPALPTHLVSRFKALPLAVRIGAAVIAVVLIALILKLTVFGGNKEPQAVTATVTRGDIEQTVLATGVLEPAKLVSVGAQASGRVERLAVVVGQEVRKGDLIAEIDSLTQQNSVRTAQANLAQMQAQRVQQAANLQQAQLAFTRQSTMLASDATSRADYEAAQATLKSAQGALSATDAQIAQAQVQLNTAQVNLGYTRITAPMDGTVVAIVTEEGTTVNSLQQAPTIVKLARLDVMQVKAQISEADVTKVRVGQTVYFTILGDPDKRYYAKLATVEPAPESIKTSDSVTSSSSSTATAIYYNGLFNVPNTDGKLRTSMTAQVYVVLADAKNVLTIPSSALMGKDMVRVMTKNGKVEPRRVVIGVNNNVQAEVLSGLAEGDQVVVAEASAGGTPPAAGGQRVGRPGGMMGGLGGLGGGMGGGRPPGGGPPGGGPPGGGGGPPGGGGGPGGPQ